MNTEIRTTVNLPAELAEKVDDYWHNNRLNSRNAAIRELLEAALATQKPATLEEWVDRASMAMGHRRQRSA